MIIQTISNALPIHNSSTKNIFENYKYGVLNSASDGKCHTIFGWQIFCELHKFDSSILGTIYFY